MAESAQYDDNSEAREAFIARVQAEGFKVVTPAENELFVDIDSDDQRCVFDEAMAVLERNGIELIRVVHTVSRSGWPREHIVVTLPFNVDPWQRLAWQAALGSDPVRELLSAIRLRRGDIHPTLFVEKP